MGIPSDGRGSIPSTGKRFCPIRSVQTHPASYQMGMEGCFFPEVKRAGREADHSPPTSAELKNNGAIPPFLHIS
jgi:hypothetical protein